MTRRKEILFIGGDIHQTSQLHEVSRHLPEYEHYFTPYYGDGFVKLVSRLGIIEYSITGKKRGQSCLRYLERHGLRADVRGQRGTYDLAVTCSDVLVQKNIRGRKIVVVQEGIFDPEHRSFQLIRRFPFLPSWLAGTAMTGLSGMYDAFCAASEGYREHLVERGADAGRIHVTGLVHYDDCEKYLDNDFPHRGYVLVCTSDGRETWKNDDRAGLIARALRIAAGRQVIFKLHPNEDHERAVREIRAQAPDALILYREPHIKAEELVANCDVLLSEWSTLVFVAMALGKECYSHHDMEEVERLMPIQNGGASARNIAEVCRQIIESPAPAVSRERARPIHKSPIWPRSARPQAPTPEATQ